MKLMLALLLAAASASAADFYYTQAGGGTGTSCVNPLSATQLNTATNWTAGNILHICGTWTGGAAATLITTQGSGSSGNPITLKFETGAILQAPYCNVNGCLVIGNNFITVDGANTGTIRNTANGTGLANAADSELLAITNCNSCVVQNLSLLSTYTHTSYTDENGFGANAIAVGGTANVNLVFSGLTITDAAFPINALSQVNNGINGIEIKNSTISRYNEGIRIGEAGGNLPGIKIHDNDIHDSTNWDDLGDSLNGPHFHHNHIHIYSVLGNAVLVNPQIYNNYFHGDPGGPTPGGCGAFGCGSTVSVYLEPDLNWAGDNITDPWIFNNVFKNEASVATHLYPYGAFLGTGTNSVMVNNTLIGLNTGQGVGNECLGIGPLTTPSAAHVRQQNNVCSTFGYMNGPQSSGVTYTAVSNNDYFTYGDFAVYYGAGTILTLAQWQAATGGDATPPTITTSPNLNASFVPNAGSPVIGTGVNLASLCIQNGGTLPNALCSDKNGLARPGAGGAAWDMGAVQSGSGAAPTISTTSLPRGTVGIPYSQTVTATGTGTITWTVAAGALPGWATGCSGTTGLTCTISGTPNAAATTGFTLQAANGILPNAQQVFALAIDPPPAPAVTLTVAGLAVTSHDFGLNRLAIPSAGWDVTLTNSGNAQLTITTIVASGDYSDMSNCPISPVKLAIAGTCTITSTFLATMLGVRNGTVVVTDDSGNTPGTTQTLTLTGTGVPALSGSVFTGILGGTVVTQ